MDSDRQVYSYSWHQSHDQATVLLLVPYETLPDDVWVMIEQNYLVAGIRGQVPIIKGRLYGNVDTETSMWQLEPRPSARGRTTSTASTLSTQSSYAYVSDPEISSSFAASLESGQVSDNEAYDSDFASPERSRPVSRDEQVNSGTIPAFPRHHDLSSHPASPRIPTSMTSSLSSVDSFQPGRSGRLLTLYLEKGESIIWPSLIVGPVPESFSPIPGGPFVSESDSELKYNMDSTSLGLMGEEYLDIRHNKEEAFEYFIRAWHQSHTPLSTLRLVQHFLPVTTTLPQSRVQSPQPLIIPPTPTAKTRGSLDHYLCCIGGPTGLARLYVDAGLLHLEGSATVLMSSTYSALSSIRAAEPRLASLNQHHSQHQFQHLHHISEHLSADESGTQAWQRDHSAARNYFDRARQLAPHLDVPLMPVEQEASPAVGAGTGTNAAAGSATRRRREAAAGGAHDLQMPSLDLHKEKAEIPGSSVRVRRRRQQAASAAASESIFDQDDDDSTWYLYLPGLIGAGTALLVVGVVSALSFSTWRKSQN